MQNTNAQYDAMQEMVNKLLKENLDKQPKPVPIPIKQTQQATPPPRPQAKPEPSKKKRVIEDTLPVQFSEANPRPDIKDFYQKTWVCAASDKKFPMAERDIRINLANEIYSSYREIYYESDNSTKNILDSKDFNFKIVHGARTEKLVNHLAELGFSSELNATGILRIGESDTW